MDTDIDALPNATDTPVAVAGDQPTADASPTDGQEQQTEQVEDQKPEKDPLEKELARERNRIQKLTSQKYKLAAQLDQLKAQLQQFGNRDTNTQDADGDKLTLSRSELDRIVKEQAERLAPTIRSKAEEEAKLKSAAIALQKSLGVDEFEQLASDLASVFDNDKQLAVLRTDAPADILRYLTDPDNADEAENIGRMDSFDAGRAIAKIEAKLASKREQKPQPSKAAAPIEAARGTGTMTRDYNTIADDAAWYEARRQARMNRG